MGYTITPKGKRYLAVCAIILALSLALGIPGWLMFIVGIIIGATGFRK